VSGFPLTGPGEQDYGAPDCPCPSRRRQAGGPGVRADIPTATTSGPSRSSRSPRAVVFHGGAGMRPLRDRPATTSLRAAWGIRACVTANDRAVRFQLKVPNVATTLIMNRSKLTQSQKAFHIRQRELSPHPVGVQGPTLFGFPSIGARPCTPSSASIWGRCSATWPSNASVRWRRGTCRGTMSTC
jgi:hypothetical protein